MCANLNLSVEALPAPAPTACCSHSLSVDMLVNWSLADCIDCSLPVHYLCSLSLLLPLPHSLCVPLLSIFPAVLATLMGIGSKRRKLICCSQHTNAIIFNVILQVSLSLGNCLVQSS